MLAWLRRELASGRVDVVHGHGMWQLNTLYPAWAASRGSVPFVQSPRGAFSRWAMAQGSLFKRPFWMFLQRPALLSAAGFHATSEDELLDIRRLGFRQPVALVPNGIDLPEQVPRSTGPKRELLYLARLHPGKGLDLLLAAWGQLQNRFPDWELRIAGEDGGYHDGRGYRDFLQALSERKQLERVSFLGGQYGASKWKVFSSASLYVLPSRSENFGVSIAEALASGVPVVVTEGTPWREVRQRGAGWWVPWTENALVTALSDAMSLPAAELEAMGNAGRLWMGESFSWQASASRLAEFYSWIIAGSSARPGWVHVD